MKLDFGKCASNDELPTKFLKV